MRFYLFRMKEVKLHDKNFEIYITNERINEAIEALAVKLQADLHGKRPLFVAVLNGAFMFAADLLKKLDMECEISFVKVASYHGLSSTGTVKELVGLNERLEGRSVVIIEDIVDTGMTLESIIEDLRRRNPSEIKVASLLFKPAAYTKKIPIDYVALEIPNDFIVGYGLDYDGLGRNLKDIYKIKNNN